MRGNRFGVDTRDVPVIGHHQSDRIPNAVLSQCPLFQWAIFSCEGDSLSLVDRWGYVTELFDESGDGGVGGAGDGDGMTWEILKGDLEGGGAHTTVGTLRFPTPLSHGEGVYLSGSAGVV